MPAAATSAREGDIAHCGLLEPRDPRMHCGDDFRAGLRHLHEEPEDVGALAAALGWHLVIAR